MEEPLLHVNTPPSDPVALWLVRYPEIADEVMNAFVTVNLIQGASLVSDLMAARDAAQTLHMIAWECGFEHVAEIFSNWYDRFCRALLFCWQKMNEISA